MNCQHGEIERSLALEILKCLNHKFGEGNYHRDQALLSLLDERGYVLLDKLISCDAHLFELTGGRTSCIRSALQIVPSTVLQVSRDKKFIRRVTSEVRIVRFLDTIFKDLNNPNNSDIQAVAESSHGQVWIATIFELRPEFAQMAWGNVRQVASACVRGSPRYTHLCEDQLRVRRKNLVERVASQIEYYFSEENMPSDKHLNALIDPEGAVPVHDLLNFPALKQLTRDPMMVLEALKDSTSVEAYLRLPEKDAMGQSTPSCAAVDVAMNVTVRLIPRNRQVINALEYLFSEKYLSQERYLQRIIEDSPKGAIDIPILLSFNRVAALNCSTEELVQAAQLSDKLAVSDDNTMVRPKNYRRPAFRPSRPTQLDFKKVPGSIEDFPLPSPNTQNQILHLLEYYFGDENFLLDKHLQSLAIDEPGQNDAENQHGLHRKGASSDRLVYGGWVPLTEIIKLHRLKLLRVTLADVRSAIGAYGRSLTLSTDGMYVRRRNPLPPGAPIIGLDGIQPEMYFKDDQNKRAFVVMQYNVLADSLCREDWFPYTSDEVRHWPFRKKIIQKQIRYRNPDLLCLEEVQSVIGPNGTFHIMPPENPGDQSRYADGRPSEEENHVAWFASWLMKDGYELHYARKEIKSKDGPPVGEGSIQIGNLLAWKVSEFEFIESKDVVLSKEIQSAIDTYHERHRALMTPGRLDRMVQRSTHFLAYCSTQVASFVRLRHKATNQQLAFCGVHVAANFRAPYLQVMQVQVCLEEIERFTRPRSCPPNMRGMPREQLPVVLCGDFNSTPDQGVVTLLATGSLPPEHIDLERGHELGLAVPITHPSHSLGLVSTHHWAARNAGAMINGLPICEQRFTQAQEQQQRYLMAQQQQQHQQQLLAMQTAGIIPAPGSREGAIPPHFSQEDAIGALARMVAVATTAQHLQQAGEMDGRGQPSSARNPAGIPRIGAHGHPSAAAAAAGPGSSFPPLGRDSPGLASGRATTAAQQITPPATATHPSASVTPPPQSRGQEQQSPPLSQSQQNARHLTLDLQKVSIHGQAQRSNEAGGSDFSGMDGASVPMGRMQAQAPCSPGIPKLPITNYTHLFSGCLDYIWLTPSRGLHVEQALGGVPLSVLAEYTGLPSPRFPSDHLPVLARLSFTKM